MRDSFSTVGVPSGLWRLFSTAGDNISTVGDSFSNVEGIRYSGEIPSVHWRLASGQRGDGISTAEGMQSIEGTMETKL